jgi:hypothetical protein
MVTEVKDIKLNMGLSLADIIAAIEELKPQDKELFIENLLAATSPDYLLSVKEARQEYRAGKTSTFDEVFKKK